MKITVSTEINADIKAVWQAITNIEESAEMISGIKAVEILEKPEGTIEGLKWKETREMFGKEAIETMQITQAKEYEFYDTHAENCGTIYSGKLSVAAKPDGTELTMEFSGEAQTLFGKLMSTLMGWMFKGSMVKMLKQDLVDIKTYVEQ